MVCRRPTVLRDTRPRDRRRLEPAGARPAVPYAVRRRTGIDRQRGPACSAHHPDGSVHLEYVAEVLVDHGVCVEYDHCGIRRVGRASRPWCHGMCSRSDHQGRQRAGSGGLDDFEPGVSAGDAAHPSRHQHRVCRHPRAHRPNLGRLRRRSAESRGGSRTPAPLRRVHGRALVHRQGSPAARAAARGGSVRADTRRDRSVRL